MEKKQTAVDLLVSLLNKEGFAPVLTDEEIQHFKQMEKEQIEEAWNSAGGGDAYSWGKDYYNANYGETKN